MAQGGKSMILNGSQSLANLKLGKLEMSLEREPGLNYNQAEMHDFFMKHYNNSD